MKNRSLIVAALVLAFAEFANAQETTGTFLGIIQDPSGAPMPRAKVTATESVTGRVHATICDSIGNYTLPLLPIGNYELRAEVAGFKRSVQSDVTLHLGESLMVNITLELGAITESVAVSATYTRVNTEESSMSALMGSRDIQAI